MKKTRLKSVPADENSRSVVEAAVDLSRSNKEGTWEDIVRRSTHQKPYAKTAFGPSSTNEPTPQRTS